MNDDVRCQSNELRNVITVQKDTNDSVARKFAEKNLQIAQILCTAYYSEKTIQFDFPKKNKEKIDGMYKKENGNSISL